MPVDWDHDHFSRYTPEQMAEIREMVDHPERFEATDDGGSPKFGWGPVLRVGMYDGWPYWKPVPSLVTGGHWYGSSTLHFNSILYIRRASAQLQGDTP
jgi:hypothetical protein